MVQGAFEFASSLGTVGLSIGVTNSNTSTICLLIEIVGMVLGRLEIFVIFKALKINSSSYGSSSYVSIYSSEVDKLN